MASYKVGCYIAVRSYEEPFYIAQCLEAIPKKSNSSKKYKIKWLDRCSKNNEGTLYNDSYEDKIFVKNIMCKTKVVKATRFQVLLSLAEEKNILLLEGNYQEEHNVETASNQHEFKTGPTHKLEGNSNIIAKGSVPENKITWDLVNIHLAVNETLSLRNGDVISISETQKNHLNASFDWYKSNELKTNNKMNNIEVPRIFEILHGEYPNSETMKDRKSEEIIKECLPEITININPQGSEIVKDRKSGLITKECLPEIPAEISLQENKTVKKIAFDISPQENNDLNSSILMVSPESQDEITGVMLSNRNVSKVLANELGTCDMFERIGLIENEREQQENTPTFDTVTNQTNIKDIPQDEDIQGQHKQIFGYSLEERNIDRTTNQEEHSTETQILRNLDINVKREISYVRVDKRPKIIIHQNVIIPASKEPDEAADDQMTTPVVIQAEIKNCDTNQRTAIIQMQPNINQTWKSKKATIDVTKTNMSNECAQTSLFSNNVKNEYFDIFPPTLDYAHTETLTRNPKLMLDGTTNTKETLVPSTENTIQHFESSVSIKSSVMPQTSEYAEALVDVNAMNTSPECAQIPMIYWLSQDANDEYVANMAPPCSYVPDTDKLLERTVTPEYHNLMPTTTNVTENKIVPKEHENLVDSQIAISPEDGCASNTDPYISSGSDYVPPSIASEDSGGDAWEKNVSEIQEVKTTRSMKKQKNNKRYATFSPVKFSTSSSEEENTSEITVQVTKKNSIGRRVYDKKHACYFCNKFVCKIARHLETAHSCETEVAKLLAMSPKSNERKEGFLCILRAGDYYHNIKVMAVKSGELILSRRPTQHESRSLSYHNYGPCPNCLGYFLFRNLWHHVKYCCPKKTHTTDDQEGTAVARRDIRGESCALMGPMNNEVSEEFIKDILSTFKCDFVSAVCKEDELILKFGALLFEKYSHHQYDFIRQNMRQLSRLLIEARTIRKSISNLSEILLPKNFDILIESVKSLCVSTRNEQRTQQYGIPSLALKLGHSLRKCSLIARGIALRKGDVTMNRNMEGFLDLMNIEWHSKVSSSALRTLRTRKLNSTQLLPITDDIVKLNKYLDSLMEELVKTLKVSVTLQNWSRLAGATLGRIVIFNKRRSGEASRITLQFYACRPNWAEQCTSELKQSLTPLESSLANRLTIVEVPGKSRASFKVPILLTTEMKTAIDTLIATRDVAGIDSKNVYIFARSGHSLSHIRGHDCLRQFCREADLQNPRLITSTKLRKYIATVAQVFDLKDTEYDWLARHLGHDIRVHREFYRLHESAVELTKVSRILLTLDKGEANKFKGKPLNEIGVEELPNIEDSEGSDTGSESEGDEADQNTASARSHAPAKINATRHQPTESKRKQPQQIVRKPWSTQEKEAVLSFFKLSIRKETVPSKAQGEECIAKHKDVLKNRTWKDVKYCVYNHINVIKKQKKK